MNTTTQNQDSDKKVENHQTKVVFNAFSPCGAPREHGCGRYFLSFLGLAQKSKQEVI